MRDTDLFIFNGLESVFFLNCSHHQSQITVLNSYYREVSGGTLSVMVLCPNDYFMYSGEESLVLHYMRGVTRDVNTVDLLKDLIEVIFIKFVTDWNYSRTCLLKVLHVRSHKEGALECLFVIAHILKHSDLIGILGRISIRLSQHGIYRHVGLDSALECLVEL